jgi:hypothetical protein
MPTQEKHSIFKGALIGATALGAAGLAIAGLGPDVLEEIVLIPEASGLTEHLVNTLNLAPPVFTPELLDELKGIVSIQPFTEHSATVTEGMRQFLAPVPNSLMTLQAITQGLEEAARNGTLEATVSVPSLATVNVVQGAEISDGLRAALGPHAASLEALTKADQALSLGKFAAIGAGTGAALGAGVQLTRNAFQPSGNREVVGSHTAAVIQERSAPTVTPAASTTR